MAIWWPFLGVLGTWILCASLQLADSLKSTAHVPWRQKLSTLEKFQLDLLNEHNAKRRIHKAAPLILDTNLNKAATNVAIKIAHGTITPEQLPSANIFSTCSADKDAVNGKDITDSWYNEICDSVFDSLNKEEHAKAFTRMLWQGSKRLGVGLYLEPHKKGKVCFSVAVLYTPQGNRRGYYPDNLNFDSFNPDYCCVVGFLGPGCKDINKVSASFFTSQPTKRQDFMELDNKKSYLPYLYNLPLSPTNADPNQDGQMIYKVPLGLFLHSPYQLSSLITPPMTGPFQQPTAMTTDRLESQYVEQNLQNSPQQLADLNGAFTQDLQATTQEVQTFNPPLDEAQSGPNDMRNYAQQITEVQPGNLANTASTISDTYTTMAQDNPLLGRLTSAAHDVESMQAMQAALSSGGVDKVGLPMTAQAAGGTANGVQKAIKVKLRFEALMEHNKLRQLHDSPPLRLNEEMCEEADAYADLLANAGEIGYLKPRDGQNLFYECNQGGSIPSPTDAVQSWYGEVCGDGGLLAKRKIQNFNFRSEEGTQSAGHFTQMIWRNTSDFCLGMTTRRNKQGYYCTYFVARYRPAGNIASRFMENVHQGYFSPQICSDGITTMNNILTQNPNAFPLAANLGMLPYTNDLRQGSDKANNQFIPYHSQHQGTQTQDMNQIQYSGSQGNKINSNNINNNDDHINTESNNDHINSNNNNNDHINSGSNNDDHTSSNSNNDHINSDGSNDHISYSNNDDHVNSSNNNDHINTENNNDNISGNNNNDRISSNNNNNNNDNLVKTKNNNDNINGRHNNNGNISNNNNENNKIVNEINQPDDKSVSKSASTIENYNLDQKMNAQGFSPFQQGSDKAGNKPSAKTSPQRTTGPSRPDPTLAPTQTLPTSAREVIESVEEENSHPTILPSPPKLSYSTTLKLHEQNADNRSMSHPNQKFDTPEVFKERMLLLHNYFRQIHKSPPLRLSQSLNEEAHRRAQTIALNFNARQPLSVRNKDTENVFTSCTDKGKIISAKTIFLSWYSQVCRNKYNFHQNDKDQTGTHRFANIVAGSSRDLGVDYTTKDLEPNKRCLYVVAIYSPSRRITLKRNEVLQGDFNASGMCGSLSDIASRALEAQKNTLRSKGGTPQEEIEEVYSEGELPRDNESAVEVPGQHMQQVESKYNTTKAKTSSPPRYKLSREQNHTQMPPVNSKKPPDLSGQIDRHGISSTKVNECEGKRNCSQDWEPEANEHLTDSEEPQYEPLTPMDSASDEIAPEEDVAESVADEDSNYDGLQRETTNQQLMFLDESQASKEYTQKFQDEAVKLYNTYRRIHGSPDVKLDSNLAKQAGEELEAIIHNSKGSDARNLIAWQDTSKNIFLDCNSEKVTSTAKRVVENWYRGVCDFNFVDPKYYQVDDQMQKFLSMIWKGTTKVGFAVRLAVTKDGLLCTYVVARHFPVRSHSDFGTNVPAGSFSKKDMCSRDKIEDIASKTLGMEEDIPFRLERGQLNLDHADEKSSAANQSDAVPSSSSDLDSLQETMSDVGEELDNQDSLTTRSANVTEHGAASNNSTKAENAHALTSLEHIVKDDEPVGSALLDNFLQSGTLTLKKSRLLPDWMADKHTILNTTGSLRTVADLRTLSQVTTNNGKKSEETRLPQYQTLDEKWKKAVARNRIRISQSKGLWRTAGLIAHNKLRKLHSAPPLQLDTDMADNADRYAEKLAKELVAIKDSEENIVLHHSNTSDGENLAMRCDDDLDLSPQEATQTWYSEECMRPYNYSEEGPQSHGHFTQVVWKNSRRLGIGYANFIGTARHCTVIVARYRPAGNFMLKFRNNVQPNNYKRSLCQTAIQFSEPTDDDFKLYVSRLDPIINKTVSSMQHKQPGRNHTSHAFNRPKVKIKVDSTKENKARNLAYHLKSMKRKSFKKKAKRKQVTDFKPGDINKLVRANENPNTKHEENIKSKSKRRGIGTSKKLDSILSYAVKASQEKTAVEHMGIKEEKNARAERSRLAPSSYDYTPSPSSFDATTMFTPTPRPDVSDSPSTTSTADTDEDTDGQGIAHPSQTFKRKPEDKRPLYQSNVNSAAYTPVDENNMLHARHEESTSQIEDEENENEDNYVPQISTTSSPRSSTFGTPTMRPWANFSAPTPTMTLRPPMTPKMSNKDSRFGEESSSAGDAISTNTDATLNKNESLLDSKQTVASSVKRADNTGKITHEDSIAREGLRIHNVLRAIHGSPPLILDKKLTAAATKEAKKLLRRGGVASSSTTLADLIKREVIAHAPGLGKNLLAKCNAEGMKISPADAVLSWYREVCKQPDSFADVSYSGELNQFSQVVWAETTHLGFGLASLTLGKEVCCVIVAFYNPPGNTFASFKQNVPKGDFEPLLCKPGVLEHKTKKEHEGFNTKTKEPLSEIPRDEVDSARQIVWDVEARPTPGSTIVSLDGKMREIDGSDVSNARNKMPYQISLPSRHISTSDTNSNHRTNHEKGFALQALHEHNKLRQLHSAAPLSMDPALSRQATQDASSIALMDVLSYADIKRIEMGGKNLYFSCSTDGEDVTGAKVTLNWYKELCNPGYDFAKRELRQGTEHFSRLIWKGSKRFGISKAVTEKDGVQCTYIVAVYSPAGNVREKFLQNVRRGLFPHDGCRKFKSLLSQVLSSSSNSSEDHLTATTNPTLSSFAKKVRSGIL